MNVIKILKTNKKEFNGTFKEAGSHYYVYFKCEKCNKETSKQKRRIKVNGFICSDCLLKNKKHSEETKKKIGEASKRNNNIKMMKESLLNSDGVDNASKIESVILKRNKTNQLRYGGNAPSCSGDVSKKIKEKLFINSINEIKSNGFEPLFSFEEYYGKKNKFFYKWRCTSCGTEFFDRFNDKKIIPRCPKCNPYIKGDSVGEKELFSFCGELDEVKKYRDKFEIDVFFPKYNFGIEYNGLYWHSNLYKDNNYHLDKQNYFKEKGINIIHFFEDEWKNKRLIVESIIKSRLNIYENVYYARKCIVKEINTETARSFLDENHIQGYSTGLYKYGLYNNDKLISVMTFGKSRFNKNYEYELVRFASLKNVRVVGGASKLFKYFRIAKNPKNIISYSDTRLFGGGLYGKLGFVESHKTVPNFYYVDNKGNRYHRMLFQKHMIKSKLPFFDKNLTEEENMIKNGFNKIYDCGNTAWVY